MQRQPAPVNPDAHRAFVTSQLWRRYNDLVDGYSGIFPQRITATCASSGGGALLSYRRTAALLVARQAPERAVAQHIRLTIADMGKVGF